jgi:hypothetical protein
MATDESIPLEDEGELPELPLDTSSVKPAEAPRKFQSFGTASLKKEVKYNRPLNMTGAGATRVRMFNAKITLGAIDHMVGVINEWLDSSQIEVKYVTQVVGTLEGKVAEPNLIMTIWY